MSTQAVVTEGRQLKPRVKVSARARSRSLASDSGLLHPFDRALEASLQRRSEVVQTAAMGAKLGPKIFDRFEQLRVLARNAFRSCERLLAGLNARRMAQGPRRLRILEKISLGEKQAVAILSVQGVQYLIGHGSGGISLLAKLDEPSCDPVPADLAMSARPRDPAAAKQGKARAPRNRAQS